MKEFVDIITDFEKEIQDPDVINYYRSFLFHYNIIFYDSSTTVDTTPLLIEDATPVHQENNPENSIPQLFDRIHKIWKEKIIRVYAVQLKLCCNYTNEMLRIFAVLDGFWYMFTDVALRYLAFLHCEDCCNSPLQYTKNWS